MARQSRHPRNQDVANLNHTSVRPKFRAANPCRKMLPRDSGISDSFVLANLSDHKFEFYRQATEIQWQVVGVRDIFIERSTQDRSDLMRCSMRIFCAGSLMAIGYFLGSNQGFLAAQAEPDVAPISEDAVKRIVESNDALKKAADQLKRDGRYESVTKSVNPFSIMVGGVDAKEDLESGNGVDPETWAALCVATFELKKNHVKDDGLADWVDTNLLGFDNEGHLTYRNKVVRIYSISRLRKLNSQRSVVLGEAKK